MPSSSTRTPAAADVAFAYVGGRSDWPLGEVLYAVYDEGFMWRFEFPDDIPGAAEFAAWGDHVGKIKEGLAASLPDRVELVPIGDPRAQAVLER